MKKSNRALFGMVALDLLLLLGIGWMVMQVKSGAWHAPDQAAAIQQITSTGGAAIGVVTAVLLFAFFLHRKRGN